MSVGELDVVIVGAGVVGLAVARRLAQAGREVVVLERHAAIGTEISSHNSEVIHAGIYYPTGSAKARLCVRGRPALYAYANARNIPHRQCGKLIVATSADQVPQLEALARQAAANGVDDLQYLSRGEALTREPELQCHRALLSPQTGIIDSHALMISLRGELEDRGGMIAFNSPFAAAEPTASGIDIRLNDADRTRVRAQTLINAAGLSAIATAQTIQGLPADHLPRAHFAKGNYFSLRRRAPFHHLIYPVPEDGGLGTHLTLDLAGQARFGPDVEWIDAPDYTVSTDRLPLFYKAIRNYWPGLQNGDLQPAYAGVRPKTGPAGHVQDFMISGPADHGIVGLVNLFGIESPGLTACLAIADEVADLID